jgi:hypothetical protein
MLLLPSRVSPRLLFLLCRTSVAAFAGRRSRVSRTLVRAVASRAASKPRPDAQPFLATSIIDGSLKFRNYNRRDDGAISSQL